MRKRGGDVVKLFKRIVSNNFAADLHSGKEERIELCGIDSGLFCIFYRGNREQGLEMCYDIIGTSR